MEGKESHKYDHSIICHFNLRGLVGMERAANCSSHHLPLKPRLGNSLDIARFRSRARLWISILPRSHNQFSYSHELGTSFKRRSFARKDRVGFREMIG